MRKTVLTSMIIVILSLLLAPSAGEALPILKGLNHPPSPGTFKHSCMGISSLPLVSLDRFTWDTRMSPDELFPLIRENPQNHFLVLITARPFRQSLQSLLFYSLLNHDADSESEGTLFSHLEYDEQLTSLLSPLFVGGILIGIAGIISRYGATPAPARTRYARDHLKAGDAHEKTLSAKI